MRKQRAASGVEPSHVLRCERTDVISMGASSRVSGSLFIMGMRKGSVVLVQHKATWCVRSFFLSGCNPLQS